MSLFESTKLEFRRQVFVLAGAKIDITDVESNNLVGFIKMKAFKLREKITIYTDKSKTQPLLDIQARQIIDFGATYDVNDSTSNQLLFSLRRKGLRSSFVRDKWLLLDSNESEFGYVEETGTFALMRRYLAWIPYIGGLVDLVFFFMTIDYELYVQSDQGLQHAASIVRRKNPFVIKYTSDSTAGPANIDNRVTVATATMLTIIEVGKN